MINFVKVSAILVAGTATVVDIIFAQGDGFALTALFAFLAGIGLTAMSNGTQQNLSTGQ